MEKGGAEVELGGLWLRSVNLDFKQGGIQLSAEEPVVEPITEFVAHGNMGGIEAITLGNLSPERVDINVSMGGGELDLTGDWRCDSDITLVARMGGFDAMVPEDVDVEGITVDGRITTEPDPEVRRPTLRVQSRVSMGGIQVRRVR